MLNSKFFIILLINIIALVALNFSLSADDREEARPTAIVETDPVVVVEPQTEVESPALAAVKKESANAAAQLAQEKQTNAEKLALLTTQLAALQEDNKRLAAQLNNLDSELLEKEGYISALKKNNRELKRAQEEHSQLLASEADLLKTNIQRQPDLLKTKPPADIVEETEQIDQVVLASEPEGDLSGAVEFGFSYAQDNQVTRAMNGRLILNYAVPDLYTLNSNLKFELEEEDDEMATEKYRWQLQGDYYLDPRNSIFARSDLQRSQFASYDKEDVYTLGYGRIVFALPRHKFNIEIGPGYRMAVPNVGEDAVSADEFIVRGLANYERILSESLQVKMGAVMEVGRENSTYGVTFKAQNKIYRELYLIFNFEYEYTENVPVDTLNQEVTSGLTLMYAF
ncbi:DUF481 domain-containing protein [Psychromonas sp.]|uniref:DUF481 domain-containing protein n=1 Tax=Psychromonas sp. TaxID=1884585 RepID=UPI003562EF29